MKSTLLLLLTAAQLFAETNLLEDPSLRWALRKVDGALGSVNDLGSGKWRISQDASSGHLLFLNEKNIPIVPGKTYRVAADFLLESPGGSLSIMLSMPGGKRSPYPVSAVKSASGTASLVFTARSDEENLRIHIKAQGEGKYVLRRLSLNILTDREALDIQTALQFRSNEARGPELALYWKPHGHLNVLPGASDLEAEVSPGGGFSCDNADWRAERIRSVEVKWRTYDEGGYLQLDFEGIENGKTNRSFQTASFPPDGRWRTLRFPVAEDSAWRGQIHSLKLSWKSVSLPCRVGLSSIRALSEDNLIPDAENIPAGQTKRIDLMRPRGSYVLAWRSGENPGMKVSWRDRRDQVIGNEELPAGKKELRFSVPELAAFGLLSIGNRSSGYPNIRFLELPEQDPPPSAWQGYWIWSRAGTGPNDTTVWFRKEFSLSSEALEARVLATGDDRCSLFVNGREMPVTEDWTKPGLLDLTGALRVGKNELLLKVRNVGAWGGALLNLFIRQKSGETFFINTDEAWTCREGGEDPRGDISGKVVLVGKVPCAPWGTRMSYTYIGPRGTLSVQPLSDNRFQISILQSPAVDTDRLEVQIRLPDGQMKHSVIAIEPSLGKWKSGSSLVVRFRLAEQVAETPGASQIFLDSRYLEIFGTSLIGETSVSRRTPRPLSRMEIVGAGERPWFVVNGVRSPPIYLDLPASYMDAPDEKSYLIRNALVGGMNVVRIPLNLNRFWPQKDRIDFSSLDRAMEALFREAPAAGVMFQAATYMPGWWLKENPDEATAFFGGEKINPSEDFQSLASKKWLTDLKVIMDAFINHIKTSPYAGRVLGVAPTDGVTFENMWSHGRGHPARAWSDYSPAAIKSYRDFLQNKYQTDLALGNAWKGHAVSLANVLPPEPSRLDASSVVNLLDPEKDRDLIDYFVWRNETVASTILANTALVKKASEGNWSAGSYYGYLLMFSRMYHHLQDGGHLRINRVASAPSVDFVYAPTLYQWRRLGLADSPMQPAEAFSSHGKLVIAEMDLRTFSEPADYESVNGKMNTVEQTLGVMDRTFGMLLARGMGGHWMEMNERWFREPVILDLIKSQMDFYRSLPLTPKGSTPREVCVVSDEDSAFYSKNNAGDGIHQLLMAEFLRRLPEAGSAFRHVLLADFLELGRIPAHKLYIFNNTLVIGAADREKIFLRLQKEKAQALWLYAPGVFFPEKGPDAASIENLLGISFSAWNDKTELRMELSDKLKKEVPGISSVRSGIATGPWYFPVSGFEETLAATPDGKPALVRWSKKEVTHTFAAVPNLPPALVRWIALRAGVWCYQNGEDPIHAGNDFVVLHAKTGGIKSLKLPESFRARAVIGPLSGNWKSGQTWEAVAGRTYGFLIESEKGD